jgi:hypothetical protein
LFIETNINEGAEKKKSYLFTFHFSLADGMHSLPEIIILKYQDILLDKLEVKHILLDYTLWIRENKEERKKILFSLIE